MSTNRLTTTALAALALGLAVSGGLAAGRPGHADAEPDCSRHHDVGSPHRACLERALGDR